MANYPGGTINGVKHGNAGAFGAYYTGSNKSKQSNIKHKRLTKK